MKNYLKFNPHHLEVEWAVFAKFAGAVSAMFIIAGILKGYDASNDDALKANHYKLIQDLAQKFKNKHSTIICRELLGLDENDELIHTFHLKELKNIMHKDLVKILYN